MSDKWHGEDFSLDLHLDQSGLGGKGRERERPNENEREKRAILGREALLSFKDSRRSDRRFPARQEAKLLPMARTTCGYQFRGVLTSSGKVGVFLLLVLLFV